MEVGPVLKAGLPRARKAERELLGHGSSARGTRRVRWRGDPSPLDLALGPGTGLDPIRILPSVLAHVSNLDGHSGLVPCTPLTGPTLTAPVFAFK